MSPTIAKKGLKDRRGFTLAEILIAAIIGTMVIASGWSVYVMVWQWWAEMSPRLDVERAARLTLLNVIEGMTSVSGLSGDVASSYVITEAGGQTTYKPRNGIAWAGKDKDPATLKYTVYPEILDQTGHPASRIKYHLQSDADYAKREFYYGTYNGQGAVYYRHTTGTSYRLNGTLGITDLTFGNFGGANNIITVTVTAQKQVYGTRAQQPFTVKVIYTDTVYLRNAL